MTEQLTSIVINALSVFLVIIIGYLSTKLSALVKANLSEKEAEKLNRIIGTLVLAAEQAIKTTGAERKAYVEQQLTALGYEVSEYVSALIEYNVKTLINYNK